MMVDGFDVACPTGQWIHVVSCCMDIHLSLSLSLLYLEVKSLVRVT